jgi:chromosome partitioning protein
MRRISPAAGLIKLAVWYGKGGVGKSTTTMMLSLLIARRGDRVLAIDLDPECGTSRDFLGPELGRVQDNLKSFLESPIPTPPPIVSSGIEQLDLLPCPPDDQRFFRHFPEHSTRLRDGLEMLPPTYHWIIMDVPNQFDNVAELGLIASDFLLLPVELTADCAERVPSVLRIIEEARGLNPRLKVIGALPLASAPRPGQELSLSAKERLVYREYVESLAPAGVTLFKTIMFRSATTVEEARSNANDRLMHWTARRRFKRLIAEIHFRIKSLPQIPSPSPHGRKHHVQTHPRRVAAEAVA